VPRLSWLLLVVSQGSFPAPVRESLSLARTKAVRGVARWALRRRQRWLSDHTLVLDGVFTSCADGGLQFHPTPPPTDAEVARLLTTIRTRIPRLMARRWGPCANLSRPGPLRKNGMDGAGGSRCPSYRRAILPRALGGWGVTEGRRVSVINVDIDGNGQSRYEACGA
jgi:hypothetical protein